MRTESIQLSRGFLLRLAEKDIAAVAAMLNPAFVSLRAAMQILEIVGSSESGPALLEAMTKHGYEDALMRRLEKLHARFPDLNVNKAAGG